MHTFTHTLSRSHTHAHIHTYVLSLIPKGGRVPFAEIVSSQNFFLPGTLYDGILGMAYVALAKVGQWMDWEDFALSHTHSLSQPLTLFYILTHSHSHSLSFTYSLILTATHSLLHTH
jgi:hypothetical protein